uniref:Uncharacterized protein n=1 Tax=Romanomermis culicivorax TaxID=13658 RepID=A0A915KP92_ROMCU
MKNLGEIKQGDHAFIGIYKEIPVGGTRATSCFFKASLENISTDYLEENDVTVAEYTRIFQENIAHQPPSGCSSFVSDWTNRSSLAKARCFFGGESCAFFVDSAAAMTEERCFMGTVSTILVIFSSSLDRDSKRSFNSDMEWDGLTISDGNSIPLSSDERDRRRPNPTTIRRNLPSVYYTYFSIHALFCHHCCGIDYRRTTVRQKIAIKNAAFFDWKLIIVEKSRFFFGEKFWCRSTIYWRR